MRVAVQNESVCNKLSLYRLDSFVLRNPARTASCEPLAVIVKTTPNQRTEFKIDKTYGD